MRITAIIILMLLAFQLQAQDTYKRTYYIRGSKLKKLKVKKAVPYKSLDTTEQKAIRESFKGLSHIDYLKKMKVNGKDVEVNIKEVINDDFFEKQTLSKLVPVDEDNIMKAFVKFKDDDDKIIVNPWRKKGRDISAIYYIPIENRGYEWLPFTEWTVSSLSIPLKYRFKDEGEDISEEFTTAFNLNFFLGRSYGETRFTHRKAVGNKSNTWKISGGLILGASTVTLNNTNTSSADNPVPSGDAVNQGLFSLGLGATYSFNKINFGFFYGWDNSIGDSAKKWNYNGKPWLGIGVGYSLFKI